MILGHNWRLAKSSLTSRAGWPVRTSQTIREPKDSREKKLFQFPFIHSLSSLAYPFCWWPKAMGLTSTDSSRHSRCWWWSEDYPENVPRRRCAHRCPGRLHSWAHRPSSWQRHHVPVYCTCMRPWKDPTHRAAHLVSPIRLCLAASDQRTGKWWDRNDHVACTPHPIC